MRDILLYGPPIPRLRTLQGCKSLGDIESEIAQAEKEIASLQSTKKSLQLMLDIALNNQKQAKRDGNEKKLERAISEIEHYTQEVEKVDNWINEKKRLIIRLQNSQYTAPTVTVTVAPTVTTTTTQTTPKATTTENPAAQAAAAQTAQITEAMQDAAAEPAPQYVTTTSDDDGAIITDSEYNALIADDGDEASPEPQQEPEVETTIKIPWYVYALGAGALIGGVYLIFRKKTKKRK